MGATVISELTFRVIFGLLYLLFFCCQVYGRIISSPPSGQKARHRKRQSPLAFLSEEHRWLALPFALLWYIGWILYVFSPSAITFFSIALPDWFRLAMAVVAAVGLLWATWGYWALGKNWVHALDPKTFMQRRNETLVLTGPYHYTRNPIYLGAFTFLIASAFVAANWLILLPALCQVVVVYQQIDGEERMMAKKFGKRYLDYKKKTPRLIPFLW